MRNLMLFLIAFIALVTFIRAFDRAEAESLHDTDTRQAAVESIYND